MMKTLLRMFAMATVAMVSLVASADSQLPRSTPAAEGVATKAVADFLDSLMVLPETEMHHVMVMRHGKVIAEMHPAPFRAHDTHTLYSESKSFVSLAVGLCIDDNLLRVTDRVATFFPDKLPATVSDSLASMTVWNLLTMTSGVTPDWTMRNKIPDWTAGYLHKSLECLPGKKYMYDSMATFMLSAIVQRVTGKTVLQLLQERIFNALDVHDAEWELSPDGICTGGWGLRLSAESQMKFGQLLLQHGEWNGQQLISRQYLDEATGVRVYPYEEGTAAHKKSPGYGYQIWRSAWSGSYRADGAFGQYVVVLPNEDMVVLINGIGYRTPKELEYIGTLLLPAAGNTALKADAKSEKRLRDICTKATLPVLKGKATAKKLVGTTLTVDGAEVTFTSPTTLTYKYDGRTVNAKLAREGWLYETTAQQPPYSIAPLSRFSGLNPAYTTAAQFAWNGDTLVIQTYWTDFISGETLTITPTTLKIHRNYTKD